MYVNPHMQCCSRLTMSGHVIGSSAPISSGMMVRSTAPLSLGAKPELAAYASPSTAMPVPLRFIFDIRARKADEEPSNSTSAPSGASRLPCDVVALLDVSGSMSGQPIALLKEATELLLKDATLGPKDAVGIFAFDSTVDRIASLAPLTTAHRDAGLAAVKLLRDRGSTDLYGAVLRGVNELKGYKHARAEGGLRSRAVVAFTDGQHNAGETKLAGCINAARAAGVPIHAIGLGASHDVHAMTLMARSTGGLYASISNNEAIADVIATLLERMQDARAQGAALELNLPQALIDAGAVIDVGAITSPFEVRVTSRTARGGGVSGVSVVIGDISAGEMRELAVPVVLPPDTRLPPPPAPAAQAAAEADPRAGGARGGRGSSPPSGAGGASSRPSAGSDSEDDDDPMDGASVIAASAAAADPVLAAATAALAAAPIATGPHILAAPGPLVVLDGTLSYTDCQDGAVVLLSVAATVNVVPPPPGGASGGQAGPFTAGFGVNALELRASADMAVALRHQLEGDSAAAVAALDRCVATIKQWAAYYGVPAADAERVIEGVRVARDDLRGGRVTAFATSASAYAAQSASAATASGTVAAGAGSSKYGGQGRSTPKSAMYASGKASKRGY